MLCASSRRSILSLADQKAGLTIEKKLEVSDPEDLSESSIEEEFKPVVDVKKAFERPKRPGRR